MKIKAKGWSAEIEIELPDEKEIVRYHMETSLIPIIDKMKNAVIEIETKLTELNKPAIKINLKDE